MKQIITVKDKEHLKSLIKDEINLYGDKCNLNHLNVSNVTNMSDVFWGSKFNGDISKWDVSKVKDMSEMFYKSEFNGDISKWDVSKVTDMLRMFYNSKFNGDISKWDVSKVKDMWRMFTESKFKGDLSDWLPYKLEDKKGMFDKCSAPTPYWYTPEDTQKAIETYQLKNKLEDKLSEINKSVKKIKI